MSNEKKRNANKIIKNTERKLEGAEKYMDGDITAKGLSVAAGKNSRKNRSCIL